jgi:dihydropteroate synthase
MIPGKGCPQVLELRDVHEVRRILSAIRVSPGGQEIMQSKGVFRLIRVSGLDVRAANILKQEMLSRGGEAATSREVYEMGGKEADCLLMGTASQFERVLPKLREQPFGLRALAASLETALRNREQPPAAPPGLELSGAPLIMGIVNLTPDSFSDGGVFATAAASGAAAGGSGGAARGAAGAAAGAAFAPDFDAAEAASAAMFEQGAALVDVGGESTRPGAESVPLAEELRRVMPLVERLGRRYPGRISIDTCKAEVAAKALSAGAYMVNDVTALRGDAEMVAVLRDAACPVILMHMLGEPRTMQVAPSYRDVVYEVYSFLLERLNWAVDQGLREEDLLVDPGIGFGKTAEHNLELLRNVAAFRSLGRPIVVGASRKRFLGRVLDLPSEKDRDRATVATTALLAGQGAHIIRVHDVGPNAEAVKVARAVFPVGMGGGPQT